MRVNQFEQRQRLPLPPEEAFEFFGDARNLEAVTPDWLHFRIVSLDSPELEEGTLIVYRLRVRGIPVNWTTKITQWEPGRRFVDEQIRGPYKLWEHTHWFEPDGQGGTWMTDRIRYAMPFGPIGRLAHRLFVRNDLRRIFDRRRERIAEMIRAAQTTRSPASE
jgi:ligand-binding SRPBCC domain-containing protein